MEVLKCKMCGGELELTENASICKCKYCGSMQTLPREKSDIRVNAYNRAGHFFMNGDFDKALALYEKILLEDPEDANAYWSCILCKYGVTYVEDPKTKERKITVNRTQNTAVIADDTYKQAIKYATAEQRELFEKEAAEIDEIQKGILAISQNEEPFDVFISYKESDVRGERTVDSVLATDLYYGLTEAGYKVFLSRITLEDKLGSEYEPYIYAALNSAKVMIVLGTKAEYFNAPWVKNEWSRYLQIIKGDRHKMLIPAYRDMDAYDLPEEFALLQAQDMSKIGFLQDIIRGVKKVIVKDKKPVEKVIEKTVVKEVIKNDSVDTQTNVNISTLLKRMFMFISDGNTEKGREYADRILDIDPECAEAYIGHLMLDTGVKHRIDLLNLYEPIHSNINYVRAYKYGDEEIRKELTNDAKNIQENMNTASIDRTIAKLKESHRKLDLNTELLCYVELKKLTPSKKITEALNTVNDNFIKFCQYAIKNIQNGERNKGIHKLNLIIDALDNVDDTESIEHTINVIIYKAAMYAKDAQKYQDEKLLLKYLDGAVNVDRELADCDAKLLEIRYQEAINAYNYKNFQKAYEEFSKIDDYKEAVSYKDKCLKEIYNHSIEIALYNEKIKDYDSALKIYESMKGYPEADRRYKECLERKNSGTIKSPILFGAIIISIIVIIILVAIFL